MIKADEKPLSEILEIIEPYDRVLVAGCGTCVTVCFAGGERESSELAARLRLHDKKSGRKRVIEEVTVQRQCEDEFIEDIRKRAGDYDVIISMACGAGVNFLAERLESIPVIPGLNTRFIGVTVRPGVWEERCAACGDCIVHLTGGICPVARCSKNILNGPCGGTNDGMCELSTPDNPIDCAWALIVDRLGKRQKLESLDTMIGLKDWSKARDGGPRRRIRADIASDEGGNGKEAPESK